MALNPMTLRSLLCLGFDSWDAGQTWKRIRRIGEDQAD